MSKRLSPSVSADAEFAMVLEAWEAEGGASADADTLSEVDRLLLQHLGAALVGEWNNLPMPLQRAVYGRAVGGGASCDAATLKRQMARFLHDHKDRPGPV